MTNQEYISTELQEAASVLNNFINSDDTLALIEKAAVLMNNCIQKGGKIISCGNGGSMCDAMHFAEELTGRFRNDRDPIAALSISDPSHISCVSNDYGYDFVFSRYIQAIGKEGDVLLAISTSGNSINIIRAIEQARENNMLVIGLTGKDGGQMAELCDVEIRSPKSVFADRAQEVHIKVIHCLIGLLERLRN
ncbi:MAG: D-sedoheptulose 7-phosphate isomerase [Bacteroidia bacterium]